MKTFLARYSRSPGSLLSAQIVKGDTKSLSLPSGFQTVDRGISYNEEWDGEADLVLDSNGDGISE